MGYTDPAFLVYHCIADAIMEGGLAALTSPNVWKSPVDVEKRRLADFRIANVAAFNAAAADHYIQVDRSYPGQGELTRVIVPWGHNFSGENVRIRASDTGAYGGEEVTILAQTAVSGTALIDLAITGGTATHRNWRYQRFDWPSSSSTAWEAPELWMGTRLTTTTGIVHAWENPLYSPIVEEEFGTREASVMLASPRRTWELTHVHLDATDVAVYDAVAAMGRSVPFWFWPPDDSYTEPLLMKLTDDMEREQDSPVPQTEVTYRVRLRMRQQTT
jgi:hypothetical protein